LRAAGALLARLLAGFDQVLCPHSYKPCKPNEKA
jgi:hypothetical protein